MAKNGFNLTPFGISGNENVRIYAQDACDNETATILGYRNNTTGTGAGNLGTINTSYDLVGVCQDCVDELTVDLECGETNTATFTFFAEEAGAIVIQGGLTNGTEIISATSNVLTRNLTHSSVKNSSSNVTRWVGNVDACEEVTLTIEFTGGNGIGDWSAKRGEVVLGSTLEEDCRLKE